MRNIAILVILSLFTMPLLAQTAPTATFAIFTDGTWTQRMLPLLTYNANPVSGAALTGGTWGAVEVKNDYMSQCLFNNNFTNPGDIITVHHENACDFTNTTTFYQKTFTLPFASTEVCDAFIDVRADDAFRVYVNGINIPSAPGAPYSSGCFGGNSAIIGMNYTTVFHVPIPSGSLVSNGNNSVIIEVQNCGPQMPDLSYVSALVKIRRNFQPQEANFQHTVVPVSPGFSNVTFAPILLPVTEKTRGIQTTQWTIEQSLNETGPFTPFLTQNPTTSVLTVRLSDCFFYRVTRTITNGCSTVSFTKIIWFCDQGMAPHGDDITLAWENTSPGVYATKGEGRIIENMNTKERLDEIITQNQAGTAIGIYPNPASDYLRIDPAGENLTLSIMDLMGRVVLTKQLGSDLSVDLSAIKINGIYLCSFKDPATGKVIDIQKVSVQR